jgi:hypothetical protein
MSVVLERACESCGEPLAPTARRNRRYCSGVCRVRALRRRRRENGAEVVELPPAPVALDEATEAKLVAVVAAAARGDWRAASWLLERGYPARLRRQVDDELPPAPEVDDAFAEVDEIAARRREQDNGSRRRA